jgi:P27 family predicted phage terminase small subunit
MADREHAPEPPSILGERGRDLWARVLVDYELAAAELAVLEAACASYDRLHEAQATLNRDGLTVLDRYDAPKAHPMTAVVRDATTLLARCLRQLDVDLDDEMPRPGALPASRRSGRPVRPAHVARVG